MLGERPVASDIEMESDPTPEVPPPLTLPPAIRPAVGRDRKVLEGEKKEKAKNLVQTEIDGANRNCTAKIMAFIDRRAKLEQRKNERGEGRYSNRRIFPPSVEGVSYCVFRATVVANEPVRRSYSAAVAG